ncbi:hypothetical protein [Teredinibacter turnerae]|uniref:hypothetical protein n=1 Tax=Teredinibacter turnerae TaxID=2426 RepID=UPI00037E0B5E|nr:hypothetical protein [Teredinibacter turnerae]
MNRIVLLLIVLLVACKDSQNNSSQAHDVLGRWKTGCFSDEVVDYWVTTEYVFLDDHVQQISHVFEDEECTAGIGNSSGGPVVSEGEYFFIRNEITVDGLTADIYGQYFLSQILSEVSELGLFVEGDVLYLVHQNSNGYYVNFDIPFYRVVE